MTQNLNKIDALTKQAEKLNEEISVCSSNVGLNIPNYMKQGWADSMKTAMTSEKKVLEDLHTELLLEYSKTKNKAKKLEISKQILNVSNKRKLRGYFEVKTTDSKEIGGCFECAKEKFMHMNMGKTK